jgi:hypothetical protein
MEQEQRNPLLEQEDYFAGYREKIEGLRNNPQLIEFDKLCFELFESNQLGKRFLELIKERYLIPALAKPGTATYQLDVMWAEGFKDFARMLLSSVISHQQRIVAGANNK